MPSKQSTYYTSVWSTLFHQVLNDVSARKQQYGIRINVMPEGICITWPTGLPDTPWGHVMLFRCGHFCAGNNTHGGFPGKQCCSCGQVKQGRCEIHEGRP